MISLRGSAITSVFFEEPSPKESESEETPDHGDKPGMLERIACIFSKFVSLVPKTTYVGTTIPVPVPADTEPLT